MVKAPVLLLSFPPAIVGTLKWPQLPSRSTCSSPCRTSLISPLLFVGDVHVSLPTSVPAWKSEVTEASGLGCHLPGFGKPGPGKNFARSRGTPWWKRIYQRCACMFGSQRFFRKELFRWWTSACRLVWIHVDSLQSSAARCSPRYDMHTEKALGEYGHSPGDTIQNNVSENSFKSLDHCIFLHGFTELINALI